MGGIFVKEPIRKTLLRVLNYLENTHPKLVRIIVQLVSSLTGLD